jgi:hypothetical protein
VWLLYVGRELLAGRSPEFESKHLPKINVWANIAKEQKSIKSKSSSIIQRESQNKLRIRARQGKEQEMTGQKRV